MKATRRQLLSLATAAALVPRAALSEPLPPAIFAEFENSSPGREAYDQAIAKGADFLVAPVAPAKDGTLVVAPEIELSGFTDVAARPEFADRRRQAVVDGAAVAGWLASDFTGAELKSLVTGPTIRGRPPETLLALQDVVDLARSGSIRQARVVGVCPRLVHPAFFETQDLAVESRLARFIRLAGYDSPAAAMIVMSSEPAALRSLGALSGVRRAQAIDVQGGPADPAAPRFQAMATPAGLRLARGWANAVTVDETLVIRPAARGAFAVSGLVADAHTANLKLFARAAAGDGNLRARLIALFLAGADGVMCADVGQAARARGAALDRLRR